jgi:hypothetical protein
MLGAMATSHQSERVRHTMATKLGHGVRRRGRRAGGKRRTPRAAVAAGALAAASIPLWPSAADAGPWGPPEDEYKSERHTVTVNGRPCSFTLESFRMGDRIGASSIIDPDTYRYPECTFYHFNLRVDYVTRGGATVSAHTDGFYAPWVTLGVQDARDLIRSSHSWTFKAPEGQTGYEYVLDHPNRK